MRTKANKIFYKYCHANHGHWEIVKELHDYAASLEAPKEADPWEISFISIAKQARIYDMSDQDFEIACRMGMAAFRKARDYNARFPHDPEWRGAAK